MLKNQVTCIVINATTLIIIKGGITIYTSHKAQYTTGTLFLDMLDKVINRLVETQDCYFCRNKNNKDTRCLEVDLCKNLIYDGILSSCQMSTSVLRK